MSNTIGEPFLTKHKLRTKRMGNESLDLSSINVIDSNQQLSSAPKIEKQILPGSSQPQHLGTISNKDMETS